MRNSRQRRESLVYHAKPQPGKIKIVPTKPYQTQRDLAIAYSPGVAEPCLEIAETPTDAYKYTAKGNIVAVISNGTAVLGLGDIGPLASSLSWKVNAYSLKSLQISMVWISRSILPM